MLTKTAVLTTCFCICVSGQLLAINPITDKYLADNPGADANDATWKLGRSNPEYLKDPAFAADFKMEEQYRKSILSPASTTPGRREPETAFWLGTVFFLGALVVCFGISRILAPRRAITSAKLLGQSWAARSIVFSSLQLGRLFWTQDTDSFKVWLFVVVVLYLSAFLIGWLYGKTVRYRKLSNVSVASPLQPATSQLTCNTTSLEDQAPSTPRPPVAVADAFDKWGQVQPLLKPESSADASTHEAGLERRLVQLKGFFDKDLITAEDYASKKRDILGEL